MASVSPMAQDLLELLRHPEPRAREIAARLRERLGIAAVRVELERSRNDAELAVRNLDRLLNELTICFTEEGDLGTHGRVCLPSRDGEG